MQSAYSTEYAYTALILRVARSCQTASSLVVLYDHVITFDQEVNHIWSQPFSFGSINYTLIRYIGDGLAFLNMITFLGGDQTQEFCEVYFFVQSWLGILVFFLIQLTLQTRIYALYGGSKIILALMVFGYVCEIAALLTIFSFIDADSKISNELLTGLYICANMQGPSFYHPYVIWVPVVVYDAILCILAVWRGASIWMSGYRAKRLDGVYITDILVKDNAGYFVCILLTCIASIVIAQCLGVEWMQVSEEFPAPMEVVIGCRLILNLRSSLVQDRERQYRHVHNDTPWIPLDPVSGSTLSD